MNTRSSGLLDHNHARQPSLSLTPLRNQFRKLLVTLVGVMLIAACDSVTPAQPAAAGPTAQPVTARGVADAFLDSWVKGDYATMYALSTRLSKKNSPNVFASLYKDAENSMAVGADGKSYELLADQTIEQGTTTVFKYNMTFDSGALGKFTDANRTLRVINEDGQWRVSWSTMDIFEGMAGGAKLTLERVLSPRGTIFDRNGKPIAQSNIANVAVRLITNNWSGKSPQDCLDALASLFHPNVSTLKSYYSFMKDKLDYGFTIGTLSPDQVEQNRAQLATVCKLEYRPQVTRLYYGNGLAAQTVGYVGKMQPKDKEQFPLYPNGALIGQAGVEQLYEKQLAGEPGAQLVITSPEGTRLRVVYSKDPGPTQDVTLTIDRDFQLSVEQILASAFENANWAQFSTGAAAVILNANTGEVLAIASYPSVNPDAFQTDTTTFDSDTFDLYNKSGAFRNRPVQSLYPLGSVMKIVSMTVAANEKIVRPSDVYTCTGIWDGSAKGDQIRKDWIYLDKYAKDKFHGPITLTQALTSSCDAYFWVVGEKVNNIDASLWGKYGNKMGLGVFTGFDVANGAEPQGYIPDPTSQPARIGRAWGLGDSLNTVIGQGNVQVSPLQVARMMAAVANGGSLYKPYMIQSVGFSGQTPTVVTTPPTPTPTGIDAQVIKAVQQGLCDVPRDPKLGTAHFVFYNWDFDTISICGKTGTAQTGTPYPNGWFAAYAGKAGQKPDIAVVVLTENSREGSETSGPIVRRIIESYYKIPYEPWPDFWSFPYELMPDPNASDGGGPPPKR